MDRKGWSSYSPGSALIFLWRECVYPNPGGACHCAPISPVHPNGVSQPRGTELLKSCSSLLLFWPRNALICVACFRCKSAKSRRWTNQSAIAFLSPGEKPHHGRGLGLGLVFGLRFVSWFYPTPHLRAFKIQKFEHSSHVFSRTMVHR